MSATTSVLLRYPLCTVLCAIALLQCLSSLPVAEAGCSTTNADGTCSACSNVNEEYGPYCDPCPCISLYGVCMSGTDGNGMCTSCGSLRYGAYCDRTVWESSFLLNWTEFGLCSMCGAMTFIVFYVYSFVFMTVRAERRFCCPPEPAPTTTTTSAVVDNPLPRTSSAIVSIKLPEDESNVKTPPPEELDTTAVERGHSQHEPLAPTSQQYTATTAAHEPIVAVEVNSPHPASRNCEDIEPEHARTSRLFTSTSRSPVQDSLGPPIRRFGSTRMVVSPTVLSDSQSIRQAASLGSVSISVGRGPGPGAHRSDSVERDSLQHFQSNAGGRSADVQHWRTANSPHAFSQAPTPNSLALERVGSLRPLSPGQRVGGPHTPQQHTPADRPLAVRPVRGHTPSEHVVSVTPGSPFRPVNDLRSNTPQQQQQQQQRSASYAELRAIRDSRSPMRSSQERLPTVSIARSALSTEDLANISAVPDRAVSSRRPSLSPDPRLRTISPSSRGGVSPSSSAVRHQLSPVPRFRVGDKVRRNPKAYIACCDFGGTIGEVLCGECVTIDEIHVHRDAEKGVVQYSYSVRGGSRAPSIPNLEDLFDVASDESTDSQDGGD